MKASAYKTIMWWRVHIDEDKFSYSLYADAPFPQKKFWFFCQSRRRLYTVKYN